MKMTKDIPILGIETCTNICSVAFWDGQKMHENVTEAARSHSQHLLPMIEQVLTEAGQTIQGVKAIACARGPGTFTGIRIGVGVAKGIAFGRDIPIMPISPLQAIAYQAMQLEQADTVTALMDARMGELYAADYKNQGGLPVLHGKEQLTNITALCIAEQLFAGTGTVEYHDVLVANKATISSVVFPLASDLIKLAQSLEITPVNATDFLPLYLRDKVTN